MALARGLIKACLTFLLGDYAPYKIYRLDLNEEVLPPEAETELEFRILEDEPYTLVLGVFIQGQRASTCWIWWGERYQRDRNFWPLQRKEAKLVHIETNPRFRGRGIASKLLRFAGLALQKRGFRRLYARVWHNNGPSIRAFVRASWVYHRFVVDLYPFRLGWRMRLHFKGKR